MNRKPISKKKRFDVFKRDGFKCVYCGATPLNQLLHVDHITPVCDGGGNEIDNLCTACIPCNQGKGGSSLSDIQQALSEKAKLIAEQEEQMAGYQKILAAKRERIYDQAWDVVLEQDPTAHSVDKSELESIKRFIEKLGFDAVLGAMEKACGMGFNHSRTYKYFFGICWNMIRAEADCAE